MQAAAAKTPESHRRNALRAVSVSALGLLAATLTACAHPWYTPACAPTAQAGPAAVRIIVTFRQPTRGDSPGVLRQLQVHSGGCVSFVSSVSPSLHVYAVAGGGDVSALRAKLLSWPAVQGVEGDVKIKAR